MFHESKREVEDEALECGFVLFCFLLGTLSHGIRDGDVKDAWDPFPG